MLASLTSKRHSSKRYFQNHFLLPNGMDSLPLKSHLEFIRIAYYSNVTRPRLGLGQCPGLSVRGCPYSQVSDKGTVPEKCFAI